MTILPSGTNVLWIVPLEWRMWLVQFWCMILEMNLFWSWWTGWSPFSTLSFHLRIILKTQWLIFSNGGFQKTVFTASCFQKVIAGIQLSRVFPHCANCGAQTLHTFFIPKCFKLCFTLRQNKYFTLLEGFMLTFLAVIQLMCLWDRQEAGLQ
jgi:hypothetical protein